MQFSSTADIPIPQDPLEQIIGQDEAVRVARIVAKQRRHMLLVGKFLTVGQARKDFVPHVD